MASEQMASDTKTQTPPTNTNTDTKHRHTRRHRHMLNHNRKQNHKRKHNQKHEHRIMCWYVAHSARPFSLPRPRESVARWDAGRSHEGSVTWGLGGGLGALMSRSPYDSPDPADIPLPLPWILARLRAKGLALVAEGKFFAESEITGKSKDQGTTKDKDTVKSKPQGKSKDKDKAKSKVQRKSKDKDKLKGKVQGKSTDKDKVKSKVKGKGTRCALTRENQLQPLSRWRLAVDQARSHLLLELERCARAGEPLPYIDWTNRRGGALHREALRVFHLPSPELPQGVF